MTDLTPTDLDVIRLALCDRIDKLRFIHDIMQSDEMRVEIGAAMARTQELARRLAK